MWVSMLPSVAGSCAIVWHGIAAGSSITQSIKHFHLHLIKVTPAQLHAVLLQLGLFVVKEGVFSAYVAGGA